MSATTGLFCDSPIGDTFGSMSLTLLAKFGHVRRKLRGAGWCFTAPERNIRRLPVCIGNEHSPSCVRRAGSATMCCRAGRCRRQGSRRRIFVDRANIDAFRHRPRAEQRGFRNRAAAGDCRQARPTSSTQTIVHAVAMNVGAVASALGGDALGEHLKNIVEFLAREIAIRICPPDQRENCSSSQRDSSISRLAGDAPRGQVVSTAATRPRSAARGCPAGTRG